MRHYNAIDKTNDRYNFTIWIDGLSSNMKMYIFIYLFENNDIFPLTPKSFINSVANGIIVSLNGLVPVKRPKRSLRNDVE